MRWPPWRRKGLGDDDTGDRLAEVQRANLELRKQADRLRKRIREQDRLGPLIADALRAPRPER